MRLQWLVAGLAFDLMLGPVLEVAVGGGHAPSNNGPRCSVCATRAALLCLCSCDVLQLHFELVSGVRCKSHFTRCLRAASLACGCGCSSGASTFCMLLAALRSRHI